MKAKKMNTTHYFLAGFAVSSVSYVLLTAILYAFGLFPMQNVSTSYANSLSPRKHGELFVGPTTHDPNGLDQTAPILSFVRPVDGSLVDPATKSGSYYIIQSRISASDNDRIAYVYYFVNGILDGILAYNSPTYDFTVRIPNKAGNYEIKALAYDYNGNSTEVKSTVTVPERGK